MNGLQGATEMGRKSRKNKLVTQREPNGRIARVSEFSAGEVRRLRDASMRGLRDPEWGTELGRYFLEGAITSVMYATGKWWAELATSYRAAIGSPADKSPAIERGSRASPPDPDSDAGQAQRKHDRRAVEEFEAALVALKDAGLVGVRAVRALCERNEGPTGYQELEYLRVGLARLAEWRDLTRRPKSVHSVR